MYIASKDVKKVLTGGCGYPPLQWNHEIYHARQGPPLAALTTFCFLITDNSYLQPEADGQSSVDLVHGTEIQLAHFVFEPFFVNSSYLFEKDDAVLCQTALIRLHLYMSWQVSFVTLTGNSRRNNSWTVPVANVVLDNKYRSYSALFRTHNGT